MHRFHLLTPTVEEIMHMLLSFPVDADAAIREIISETIYTNSTTMDGRRFADDFVSRRKADVTAHAKSGGASKGLAKTRVDRRCSQGCAQDYPTGMGGSRL